MHMSAGNQMAIINCLITYQSQFVICLIVVDLKYESRGHRIFFLVSKLFISFKIIILKNLKILKGRLLLLKSLLFQFFM